MIHTRTRNKYKGGRDIKMDTCKGRQESVAACLREVEGPAKEGDRTATAESARG